VALAVAGMLIAGTRQSATFNILLVVIKLTALAAFVLLALPAFDAGRLTPFAPYGLGSVPDAEGTTRGVMAAAAIVFFAFYGFDAVATSAEEAKRPGRDLTIGIIGSMAVCTIIYMLVAVSAVGAVDWRLVARSSEPLAFVLRTLDHPLAANLVALAALVALPSVILVMMYGQSRIFFVMARDGLLPRKLSEVSPRTGAPVLITAVTGVFVAAAAGLFRLDEIAELANAGTLLAFIAVAACMMILRRTRPDLKRVFRCPAPFLVGTLAILGCAYLIFSLPAATLVRFLIWNAIGLAVYFAYGRARSLAGRDRPVTGI
jgi:APA family basic amino acid/polyamine antiporter